MHEFLLFINLSLLKKLPLLLFLISSVVSHAQWVELGFQERTIKVDDHRIHYRVKGQGPVLMMLHGITLNGDQWLHFADAYADSNTVIVPDLPGHGGSTSLPGEYSFGQNADLMLRFMDEIGADTIQGIGHSAGGIILLHMGHKQPARLQSIAVINAPHYMATAAREIARNDTWENLDEPTRQWYLELYQGDVDKLTHIFRQYNGLAESKEELTRDQLAQISAKVLVVWGEKDPAFTMKQGLELYQSLPHSALFIIPEQGHTPLWEEMGGDPEAAKYFIHKTKTFLRNKGMDQVKWF